MQVIQGVNDQATLLKRYTEATEAYHWLAMGKSLIEGRHSVEMMKFNYTTLAQLSAYISQLAGQLQAQGVTVPGGRTHSRNIIQNSTPWGRRRRGW